MTKPADLINDALTDDDTVAVQQGHLRDWQTTIDELLAAVEFAHAEGFQWPSDPIPKALRVR